MVKQAAFKRDFHPFRKVCALLLFLSLIFFHFLQDACAAPTQELAVFVNENVKETEVSKSEIKQVLLANKLTWQNGSRVVLVTLAPDANGAEDMSLEFMAMTRVQAKQYWLTKVFGGTLPTAPLVGDSNDEVIALVEKTKGAFAVLPKSTKPGKAKILNIK